MCPFRSQNLFINVTKNELIIFHMSSVGYTATLAIYHEVSMSSVPKEHISKLKFFATIIYKHLPKILTTKCLCKSTKNHNLYIRNIKTMPKNERTEQSAFFHGKSTFCSTRLSLKFYGIFFKVQHHTAYTRISKYILLDQINLNTFNDILHTILTKSELLTQSHRYT